MDNWYVMLVRTGKENSAASDIQKYNIAMDIKNILPFVPTKERFFKKKDYFKKELLLMFPGYMFAETSINAYDFMDYVKDLRHRYDDIMRVLSYGDSGEIALRWEEQLALMRLMNHKWCVEASVGFNENDRVKIISGALMGYEANIIKVDKYKMRASIELEIYGQKTVMEFGLQVLSK